jgi:ligand-binding sensor domain-containing protein
LNGAAWTVYTTASGLPSNLVYAAAFDLANVKWIATAGGMARFDGATWTSFTTANSSIPQSNVSSVLVDDSGNKWVGTIDGGLGIYQLGGIQGVTAVAQPGTLRPALSSNSGTSLRLSRSAGNVAIDFSVALPGLVTITVCDLAGRTIWHHREIFPAGCNRAVWHRSADSNPGTCAVIVRSAGVVQRTLLASGPGL